MGVGLEKGGGVPGADAPGTGTLWMAVKGATQFRTACGYRFGVSQIFVAVQFTLVCWLPIMSVKVPFSKRHLPS